MCSKPPKPPKAVAPPPVEVPQVQLGNDNPNQDLRQKMRRGRNALRTGLTIDSPSGSGLTIE